MKCRLFRILFWVLLTQSCTTVYSQVVNSSITTATQTRFRPDVFTIVYKPGPSDSIGLAITDLKKYITQVIPGATVLIKTKPGAEKLAGNLILVDETNDPVAKKYRADYGISALFYAWNSFAISGKPRKDNPAYSIHFLQGSGAAGKQYACYEFIEKYLGVRFLHPEFEHVPVSPDFQPSLVNTGVQKPNFDYRGLYPWNYNWNYRGLYTFCDIEYHFVNKDWGWYMKLCDWMVKNKQNAVFWFDDVWTWNNVSGQFPDSVSQYYAKRGVKKMLGLGWASNSGRPRGRGWEESILLDKQGKPVDDFGWQTSIAPNKSAYYPLAETNISLLQPAKNKNALGLIIGYGENTWASNESDEFVERTGIKASDVFIKDLNFVTRRMKEEGLGNVPVGFKVSSYSQRKVSPFNTDNFFNRLPKNTIFSMHTYRFDTWKLFAELYRKIDAANAHNGANMKVLHIGEVAFICNAEIPLLRTSTLRTREAHLRTLPKQSTFCHMTTLNTTQYLYWLMSYQMMQWQWKMTDDSWFTSTSTLFNHLYGAENGGKLNHVFEKMNALEYIAPSDSSGYYLGKSTEKDLEEPGQWTRYKNISYSNETTHSDTYGFRLWSVVKELPKLTDAQKSIADCQATNESLYKSLDSTYKKEFYPTIALTLRYYNLRVNHGLYSYYLNRAKATSAKSGWNAEVEKDLVLARTAMQTAISDLDAYDRYFAGLLKIPSMDYLNQPNIAYTYVREAMKKDIQNDFVFNPSKEFFTAALAALDKSVNAKQLTQ